MGPASSANRLLGRVCVEATGKPAPGVLVTLTIKGREVRTGTDSTGRYILTGIPLGEFTVRARGLGYYPEQRQIAFGGCGWRLVDSAGRALDSAAQEFKNEITCRAEQWLFDES